MSLNVRCLFSYSTHSCVCCATRYYIRLLDCTLFLLTWLSNSINQNKRSNHWPPSQSYSLDYAFINSRGLRIVMFSRFENCIVCYVFTCSRTSMNGVMYRRDPLAIDEIINMLQWTNMVAVGNHTCSVSMYILQSWRHAHADAVLACAALSPQPQRRTIPRRSRSMAEQQKTTRTRAERARSERRRWWSGSSWNGTSPSSSSTPSPSPAYESTPSSPAALWSALSRCHLALR